MEIPGDYWRLQKITDWDTEKWMLSWYLWDWHSIYFDTTALITDYWKLLL